MARLMRLGMAFRPGLEWRENIRYPIEHVHGLRPLRPLLENDRSLLESGANPEPVLGPRSARTREDLAPSRGAGVTAKYSIFLQFSPGWALRVARELDPSRDYPARASDAYLRIADHFELDTSACYKSVSRRERTYRDGGTAAVQRIVEAWREPARRK